MPADLVAHGFSDILFGQIIRQIAHCHPMPNQLIPNFYLYGEPHRLVDKGFVHIEALDERSRPSEWMIQPHSHAELSHLFIILSGGGAMRADGDDARFRAPAFLIVPATIVHGFEWLEDTTGFVITMANSYMMELHRHDPDLKRLLEKPVAVPIGGHDRSHLKRLIGDLVRELAWSAAGHRAAVDAAMLSLLVIGLRHLTASVTPNPGASRHALTVARLRQRIEERFRLREPVSVHAQALGVSPTALRVACAGIAGRSPREILDQRALLEAHRALLYSDVPVAEVGFSIGFSDPAYFSRFFQRNMGISPRAYRDKLRGSVKAPPLT